MFFVSRCLWLSVTSEHCSYCSLKSNATASEAFSSNEISPALLHIVVFVVAIHTASLGALHVNLGVTHPSRLVIAFWSCWSNSGKFLTGLIPTGLWLGVFSSSSSSESESLSLSLPFPPNLARNAAKDSFNVFLASDSSNPSSSLSSASVNALSICSSIWGVTRLGSALESAARDRPSSSR